MIYGFEKYVACEPYQNKAPEIKSVGGELSDKARLAGVRRFDYIVSKNLLVPLKVVYPNVESHIWAGDYVFVKHSEYAGNAEWAKEVEVEVPGGEKRVVVVVPLTSVFLVQRDPPPPVEE